MITFSHKLNGLIADYNREIDAIINELDRLKINPSEIDIGEIDARMHVIQGLQAKHRLRKKLADTYDQYTLEIEQIAAEARKHIITRNEEVSAEDDSFSIVYSSNGDTADNGATVLRCACNDHRLNGEGVFVSIKTNIPASISADTAKYLAQLTLENLRLINKSHSNETIKDQLCMAVEKTKTEMEESRKL